MADVFLERSFEEPLTVERAREMPGEAAPCMLLHKVEWCESFLREDGRRMICRLRAPDAESVRIALRQAGVTPEAVWSGTIHAPVEQPEEMTTVVVERRFEWPAVFEEIQALEDAGAWCLDLHHVAFQHTFFSGDRTRMICIYQAPDAESVRLAQRQAKMPLESVWPCQHLS